MYAIRGLEVEDYCTLECPKNLHLSISLDGDGLKDAIQEV
jgi:hypothetical protein